MIIQTHLPEDNATITLHVNLCPVSSDIKVICGGNCHHIFWILT